ncbi:MAG TPA: VCBS repeat-containing protein [Ohtaekwangia sp.]|nr:VCBS repeat-containing protein [Ohtaekwangia sp.]
MFRRSWFLILLIYTSCNSPEAPPTGKDTLFKRLSSDTTGIHFENTLTVSEDFDVFRYRNFYNGGGVGIGDINNDGLPDVYLTSNMGDNKLYLNKGGFRFEDITAKAGVKGAKDWSTGVSIADVNADGLLDIYVSNSGDIKGDNRENELFINNGNLTFTDKAAEFGLADKGFSTHAAFFDYDKDGDLDCYVLNNSFRPISTLGYRNLRNQRDPLGGHKLYKNDNGKFTDVSEDAGIYGSVIGFGLGVTVGDVNQDNWPDMYISNDFYERDYLYINNHDGTFVEALEKYIGHLSMFSMGADLADLNNDGLPEIFSTDMLPDDNTRLKTLSAFETYDVYQLRLQNGYYHQFMRNMLQMNTGDSTFIEVGELAGVSATDWSWGALLADFNNDAYKEIFVCNGIYKDVTDQDFVEFLGSSDQIKAAMEGKKIDFRMFVDRMNSQKLGNHMFTRKADWQYEDVATAWGLDEPGFSNGAAYGDLDNDGDLDLVVNNVNMELFVYRNQSREEAGGNYLALRLKGYAQNLFGLGASVHAFTASGELRFDQMPMRGFQSSMDYKMLIGLGQHESIDSLVVLWPDNTMQVLKNVAANQELVLDHTAATETWKPVKKKGNPVLTAINTTEIRHRENSFNDFDRDRLLYHMLSTQGPAFAKTDLNRDGRDDFFIGGSVGTPGAIYVQQPGNAFKKITMPLFDTDSLAEDVDAVFFDADGDGDEDLFVVTGGSEHTNQSPYQLDRLYINQGMAAGRLSFEKADSRKLPRRYQSGSCVRPADIDNDGDIDLFVGTGFMPSYYGLPCDQFILLNDGRGNFSDASAKIAPAFKKLGMVTDAAWFDYDKNGFSDLLVIGDWMPVMLFMNNGNQLLPDTIKGLENLEGWWNTMEAADLDQDGDTDFVLGNLGQNSMFKPTVDNPVALYVNDFDRNGSIEPIFATAGKDGAEYPTALRQDIVKQMSSLKKQFVYYKDYAGKSVDDIFDRELLDRATVLKFREPRTGVLMNNGASGFHFAPLPVRAQVAPVFGIAVVDANADSYPDILLGGNLFAVKPEAGRYDALRGLLLSGDGKGGFTPLTPEQSGLNLPGEVRHIRLLNSKGEKVLAFIRNNDSMKFYSVRK